jgi:hypothetical protein
LADILYLKLCRLKIQEARRMLKVEHFDLIRQKLRDGMSEREVAKELG